MAKKKSRTRSFLIGTAIGAVVAALFAPKSGKKTRKEIKKSAKTIDKKAKKLVKKAKSAAKKF